MYLNKWSPMEVTLSILTICEKLAEIFIKYSRTMIVGFSFISFGWSHHISRLVSFVTHWFVLCCFCLSRCSTNWSGTQCERPAPKSSKSDHISTSKLLRLISLKFHIEEKSLFSFYTTHLSSYPSTEGTESWKTCFMEFCQRPTSIQVIFKDEALSSYLVTGSIIRHSFRFWGFITNFGSSQNTHLQT